MMKLKYTLVPLMLPLTVIILGTLSIKDKKYDYKYNSLIKNNEIENINFDEPIRGQYETCRENPSLSEGLIREGYKMGVKIRSGEPELAGKDASYRATPNELGIITIKDKKMSKVNKCMLINHEFIHVLQHIKGKLKGVTILGWETTSKDPIIQEAEAYSYQNEAGYILKLLKEMNKYEN